MFGAVLSGGGSVMVQVVALLMLKFQESTCHVIKLLRVGLNDLSSFFVPSTYLMLCSVHNEAAHFDLGICFKDLSTHYLLQRHSVPCYLILVPYSTHICDDDRENWDDKP